MGTSPIAVSGADPLFPALNLNPMTAASSGPGTRQPPCLEDPTKSPGDPSFPSTRCCYLDQPTRGGAAQAIAMIQVRARPMMAWFSPKRKLLMGLHTTTYLSMARTTKDHRAISPAR